MLTTVCFAGFFSEADFVLVLLLVWRLMQKFMDDAEQCLTLLEGEMKTRVQRFILTLREFTRTQCETNGSAIQKNISRICQDQARLHEVRCGIESLMQESDPFRFVEVSLAVKATYFTE